MTVRDLCNDVLSYLNVTEANETPDGADLNLVLRAVNRIISSWVVQEYLAYTLSDQEFTLVPGQADYTIGIPVDEDPVDFETRRPTEIIRSWIRLNGVDYQVDVINNQQYNDIAMKAIETTFPQFLYYEADYPIATIKLWPVPTEALTINLTVPGIFTTGYVLADTFELPPGYEQALLWTTIVEVAPAFSKEVSADTRKHANDSRACLYRLNNQNLRMKFDRTLPGNHGRYNIYTDGYQ